MTNPAIGPRLIRPSRVAAILGVSEQHLSDQRSAELRTGKPIGPRWKQVSQRVIGYYEADVYAWLEAQPGQPDAEKAS